MLCFVVVGEVGRLLGKVDGNLVDRRLLNIFLGPDCGQLLGRIQRQSLTLEPISGGQRSERSSRSDGFASKK